MKKILITGACGYIGARLSKYLAEKGYGVTAFDSYDPSMYIHWTSLMEEVIIGDIRDETTLSSLVEKQFDVVIHLISLDHHKSENNPNFVSSINVMPTWQLLDCFTNKGLEKFIYFSTRQVLGKLPPKIINENCLANPSNKYGLTHLLSEKIVDYYNNVTETKCVNLRLSNGYGCPVFKENNCWWLVLMDFCKTAFQQGGIRLLSDGSPQRDFIQIDDICRAVGLLAACHNRKLKHNVYNLGSGKTYTILELAHQVSLICQDRYGKEYPVIFPDGEISTDAYMFYDIPRFKYDISRLAELGFEPTCDLMRGINEILDFLEKSQKQL